MYTYHIDVWNGPDLIHELALRIPGHTTYAFLAALRIMAEVGYEDAQVDAYVLSPSGETINIH